MTWIIILIVGLGLGYWVGRNASTWQKVVSERDRKVMSLLDSHEELYNDLVESALDVSDSTATRILDELEKAGVIVQVGTTGRGVVYKRK